MPGNDCSILLLHLSELQENHNPLSGWLKGGICNNYLNEGGIGILLVNVSAYFKSVFPVGYLFQVLLFSS